jgi:flagellar biosynthesis/type III secretory pathway protein FliH
MPRPPDATVRLPRPLVGARRAVEGAVAPPAPKPEPDAAAQIAPLLKALADAVASLEGERTRLAETAAREAMELSLALSRRIVASEIDAGRHGIEEIVRAALARVSEGTDVRVRLHPDDARLLETRMAGASGPPSPLPGDLRVERDDGVARGACVVEAGSGRVLNLPELFLERAAEALPRCEGADR